MRKFTTLAAVFLTAQLVHASDVRDVINADTNTKAAVYVYKKKMNFFVVDGPRDGYVTLRAFRGTRDEVMKNAGQWAPNCAQLQHLVFGGRWQTENRLTFNERFDDWAVPLGSNDDGHWLLVFDVQPASTRVPPAGFLGVQELQIDQNKINDYFASGLEVTVTNTRPPAVQASSTTSSSSAPAAAAIIIVPRGGTAQSGTNVIHTRVIPPVTCTIPQNVLPGTTLLTAAPPPPAARSTGLLARLRAVWRPERSSPAAVASVAEQGGDH